MQDGARHVRAISGVTIGSTKYTLRRGPSKVLMSEVGDGLLRLGAGSPAEDMARKTCESQNSLQLGEPLASRGHAALAGRLRHIIMVRANPARA